jgi:hypothetical protein
MATVEELQTSLDALRADFEAFKNYAKPVIDGHQPQTIPNNLGNKTPFTLTPTQK